MGDETEGSYWNVRNSWGEFWGEMGYVRVAFGALNVEDGCAWAVPGEFTAAEKNNQFHCHEVETIATENRTRLLCKRSLCLLRLHLRCGIKIFRNTLVFRRTTLRIAVSFLF